MDPQRWNRIRDLVGEALALPPEARADWLAGACPDGDLRREAESLLAQESGLTGLDRPPVRLLDVPPELPPGHRVGPYRVISEVGRGGMGVVYLAERADEEYERRVALKVLKRGLDTEEIVRRFRTERQILANLRHPGIAELYDGGTTEDGRPYFVMEHVEGERIDRWCDRRRLGVRARLRLFLRVCDAVQMAHQSLIVHRDLKPANILVTEAGEPKLLDFGIAKLLDPASGEPLTRTAADLRPMTPEYASPEQVRADPVTTATDVYALGLLLYELLTGRRPYRLGTGSTPEDLRRAICEVEPLRPSAAVLRGEEPARARGEEPKRLARRLSGDLDVIVLGALEKDLRRRYASVGQLSEDLRRHLEGLPIRARKPTFAYRAGKFLRRNGRQAAAAALAVGLLAGFLADREIQQRETARQRDRAEQNLARAERVTEFLVELFEVSDPSEARGNTVTAREVLDRGAARIREELGEEPEVRAALMDAMGEVYQRLGLYREAAPLLEEALALRRRVHGGVHLEVADSLGDLADLRFAQREAIEEAERLYREALEIYRELLEPTHPVIARTLGNLALLAQKRGDIEGAEKLFRRVVALQRTPTGSDRIELAVTLNNLAILLQNEKRDYDGAEPLLREALTIKRQILGGDHVEIALALNNLALLQQARQRYDEAEALHQESLALMRRLYGPDHPRIAATLSNLGALAQKLGNLEAAETYYRESLRMRRELLAPEHPDIARAALRLARVLATAGRHASAEPLLGEAVGIFERSSVADTWMVPYTQGLQGISLAALGRFEEAEPLLLAGYVDAVEANAEAGVRALRECLFTVYTGLGRPEEAARYRTPSSGDAPSGSASQNAKPEVNSGVMAQRARSGGLPSIPTPAGSRTQKSSGHRLRPEHR